MKYNILIVIALITFVTLLFPHKSYALTEAGSSAQILTNAKKASTELIDLNVKRKVIYTMLHTYNSPLESEVDAFIDTCTKYNIDCYLLPSIAGLESSFGKFTSPGSHNPFGWGGGYLVFNSWADCIDAVGQGIRNNYIDKNGADTIEKMGPIYAASPTWSQRVNYFHAKFEAIEAEKELYFSNLIVELY